MSQVLFDEVIRIHESKWKPNQSRFCKESIKYWSAKYPSRAHKVNGFYVWIESTKPMNDVPRRYFVEVMNGKTGLLSQADHYTLPEIQDQLTSDKSEARKHLITVIEYLKAGKPVKL